MNKPTHEKIYLVPEDGIYCWSTTPAPGAQHESNDAVEYVRGDLFESIKAERDALAAQIEACSDALKSLLKTPLGIGGSLQPDGQFYYKVAESVFKKAESTLSKTPQQCLRDVQAKAGVKGLRRGVALASGGDISLDSILVKIWSDGYAESVRQGGAE